MTRGDRVVAHVVFPASLTTLAHLLMSRGGRTEFSESICTMSAVKVCANVEFGFGSQGRSVESSDDGVTESVVNDRGDVKNGESACSNDTHKTPDIVVIDHVHAFRLRNCMPLF